MVGKRRSQSRAARAGAARAGSSGQAGLLPGKGVAEAHGSMHPRMNRDTQRWFCLWLHKQDGLQTLPGQGGEQRGEDCVSSAALQGLPWVDAHAFIDKYTGHTLQEKSSGATTEHKLQTFTLAWGAAGTSHPTG